MGTYRENVSLWFEQSEPDYYLFFLKAWIPFNAWYVAEFPVLNKNDKKLIAELQDGVTSKPRDIIENFLVHTNGFAATRFRSYLAELHHFLEKNPISHNGSRLSFSCLALTENPIRHQHYLDNRQAVYKVERTKSYFQAYIQEKGGKVLIDSKQSEYDQEGLKNDVDYIRLPRTMQRKLYQLFETIDPKKPTSVISTSAKKSEYIELKSHNSCKMIADKRIVAKACIKVLYALRCILFHGEIAPTQNNKPIYENAYYLLQLIIKELQ